MPSTASRRVAPNRSTRMLRRMLRYVITAAVPVLVAFCPDGAWPQAARTIKIVVPFPPGSGTDILARLAAERIGRTENVTIIVENRPGAGTVIATEAVARAAPDGNTLLIVGNALVIHPHLRKLSYDPLTGFEPICNLATAPQFISVNSASPYRSLNDLLSAVRSQPGALTLASLGPASATHIAFERLKRAANIDMTFVPFPGNVPAGNALLGGHVTSTFTDYASVAGQYKVGTLRALATASRQRNELLPNVPTIAESGYKDYEASVWLGAFAPARTPKQAISQLAAWLTSAVEAPEIKSKLALQGLLPSDMCGVDFAVKLREQYNDYGRVIREANIKAE
jgi:tripartite-type tricarboxylate transporter receptor subunit TctC